MADYRILCADLVSNTIREELYVHDVRYSEILNAPGAFSGWIGLDDPKCTRTNLDPGGTAIYVERGGLLVWGGILWTAKANSKQRQLALGAEGFWSYFRRRFIRALKTYASQDQLFIVRDLINWAQTQPGGSLGVTVGSETSGIVRDRTFNAYERKNLAEAIEQLAAADLGFDFEIAVGWSGNTPTKTLVLYYPRRGIRLDGLVFDATLAGVDQFELPVDATQLATQIDAIGAGDADRMLISTAGDTSLLSRYPLLEDVVTYKDVTVQATLTAQAAGNLTRRRLPLETPSMQKRADLWPDYGAFQVGDEGLVVANDGWLTTSNYYRVYALEVAVADDGTETLIPTFVSADLL